MQFPQLLLRVITVQDDHKQQNQETQHRFEHFQFQKINMKQHPTPKRRIPVKIQPLKSDDKLHQKASNLLSQLISTPNTHALKTNDLRSHQVSPIKQTKFRSLSQMQPELQPLSSTRRRNLLPLQQNKFFSSDKQQGEKVDMNSQSYFEYVLRFSVRTRKGAVPSLPNKQNQDSFLTYPQISKNSYQHFFAVCDGHGAYGHQVSQFAKLGFPPLVQTHRSLLMTDPPTALKTIFKSMEDKLKQTSIDTAFSGSTVVTVYMLHDNIYCANLGDSRAIVGRRIGNKWSSVSLTRDHKPTDTLEAQRILANDGRIQPFQDQNGKMVGPSRVWLKGENIPGLAMTRSLGDDVATTVGVIGEPEITHYQLKNTDQIIVMGSDGLFEWLSNDEIIAIVGKHYEQSNVEQGCDDLMRKAVQQWQAKSTIIDDITFIVFYLNY